MNPAENKQPEPKPEEPPPVADDLIGAIGAAVGEPAAEPELPPDPKPEIQPGKTPSVEDAFADMSQPPPAPPVALLVLDHSSSPPKGAFRAQMRDSPGVFLWMFSIPWGESQTGEAFVHPFVASLRTQILLECPALIPVRYEIKLIRSATGKFSLLEIPADPAKTQKREATRQSLLQVIEHAEKGAILAAKAPGAGGTWGPQDAGVVIPDEWPGQSLRQLVGTTYKADLITAMDHPVLARFRLTEDRLKWAPLKTPSESAAFGGCGSSTPNIARKEAGLGHDACAPWICSAASGGRFGWPAWSSRPARSR